MTYEQYWDGDPALVKYYRKAEELRRERRNREMWIQGMYIYDALCDVSPIFRPFAKNGTKAHPYADKPYSLTAKQRANDAVEKEKVVAEKGKRMMETFMKRNNSKFKETAQQ